MLFSLIMSTLDRLEFAARESLWTRFRTEHLIRFFELRKQSKEATMLAEKGDQNSVAEFMRSHKRLREDYEALKRDGFDWKEEEERILAEGDPSFQIKKEMVEPLENLIQVVDQDTKESQEKRQKIGRLTVHLKKREEFLVNYPGGTREELAPDFPVPPAEDPLAQKMPDCANFFVPWCMEQFYQVKPTRDKVFEGRRLAGRFYLHESSDDKQAALWLLAAQRVPELNVKGTFRGPGGKLIIATKASLGKTLASHIVNTPDGCPRWFWAKQIVRLCEIADGLWDAGLCYENMSLSDVLIHLDGTMGLESIEKIRPLASKNDRTMIHSLGAMLHLAIFKMPKERSGMVSTSLKEANRGALEFIKLATIEDDEYCYRHPISGNRFVQFDLKKLVNSYPCLGPIKRPDPAKTGRKDEGLIEVTEFVPQKNSKTVKKYLKQYRLLECVLARFGETSESCALPIDIRFYKLKGTGPNVSDSLFVEAWRFLISCHSSWQFGPRGYYMTSGKTPCIGCEDTFCHFATETKCLAIGKWMANTLLRPTGVPIPLPLDPLFIMLVTQTIHMFEGMRETEAEREYERLLEDRENLIWKVGQGIRTADEFKTSLQRIEIPVLVSWLCKPTPVDRNALVGGLNAVPLGKLTDSYALLIEWIGSCTEMQIRWFLMEATGSPVLNSNGDFRLDVYLSDGGLKGTNAQICEPKSLTLPVVRDKELFFAIMDFKGPFLFYGKDKE